jgi:glutathione S-transferase
MESQINQKTIPTLYKLSSSMAHRVHWALEELASTNGLKYHLKTFTRRAAALSQELKTVFPLGKSPILTLEPVDGSPDKTYQILPNTLTEARLILQFISDNYSNGIWVPESEEDKMRDIFFQEFANSTVLFKVDAINLFEVIPMMLPFPFQYLTLLMVKPIKMYFSSDMHTIFQILEDALSEERPWFAGKKLGLSDFNMSFAMDIAVQKGYFDMKKYPKLAKWHDTVLNRPAYQTALVTGGVYDLKYWR